MEELQSSPQKPDGAARGRAVLALGVLGTLGVCGCLPVALGLGDGREQVEFAIWISILAGFACFGRSAIHVLWGRYLTRHPSSYPEERLERIELNVLVPINMALAAFWVWSGFSALHQKSPETPFLPAFVLSIVVTLVAMETVRCARRTGKRRGTEIVCEGPVGTWFRDLAKTTDEGAGVVHRGMVFLRNPNAPRKVSRFLMLLATIILIPYSVHLSTAAGRGAHRLVFGGPPSESSGGPATASDPQAGTSGDDPGSEGSGEGDSATGPEECAVVYDGEPAPDPNREELAGLFHAEGAEAAGCPTAAREVAGQEGVWFAQGYCGDELRSFGVTAPDYLPAMLYQQAAEFADARAAEGVLLGASSRWPFRAGDLYVVNTTSGSYVLVRRRSSTGTVETGQGDLPCDSYTTGNLPYTVLPPGLVRLWLELAESGWVWPRSTGSADGARSFEFLLDYPDEEPVALATCPSEQWCTLDVNGERRETNGWPYTSVPEIENVATGGG
jgi:hypothetical protein